jgi:hypothetical protein
MGQERGPGEGDQQQERTSEARRSTAHLNVLGQHALAHCHHCRYPVCSGARLKPLCTSRLIAQVQGLEEGPA